VRQGRLSWCKAREFVRVATPETAEAWVERARGLSCRELEAAVAAEQPAEGPAPGAARLSARFVGENTVRVTVDLTPEQFALLDQAIGAIRTHLGTEDAADALELIARAYLARLGEEAPALRQHVVVHRCRECRTEWRETSKGRIPARVTPEAPTELVEVDEPQGEAELERQTRASYHVRSRRSRYVPRDVLRKIRWRDEGRCQVPGCLNGRWSQLHHVRFFARGGRQRTRNLLTLCTAHHRQLHEGALVLRAGDAEHHRFTDTRGRPV
jgi:hypothetical protein